MWYMLPLDIQYKIFGFHAITDDVFRDLCKNSDLGFLHFLFCAQAPILQNKSELSWHFKFACDQGNVAVASLLFRLLTVDDLRKYQRGVLTQPCVKGHVGIVEFLSRRLTVDYIRSQDTDALYWACKHGFTEIVKLLCRVLTVDDIHKQNAFVVACSSGNVETVEYVSRFFTAKELCEKNAFIMACLSKNIATVLFVSRFFTTNDLLNLEFELFCHHCAVDLIPTLVRIMSYNDNAGNTLLHRVTMRQSNEIVALVFENQRQSLAISNHSGKTPMHLAMQHNNRFLVQLFQSHVAIDVAVNIQDEYLQHFVNEQFFCYTSHHTTCFGIFNGTKKTHDKTPTFTVIHSTNSNLQT